MMFFIFLLVNFHFYLILRQRTFYNYYKEKSYAAS